MQLRGNSQKTHLGDAGADSLRMLVPVGGIHGLCAWGSIDESVPDRARPMARPARSATGAEGAGAMTDAVDEEDSAGARTWPNPRPFGSGAAVPFILEGPTPLTSVERGPGRPGDAEPARASSVSPYSRFQA